MHHHSFTAVVTVYIPVTLFMVSGNQRLAALQGTYYGDNGWAGWCAGNLPNEGRAWPPYGGQQGMRVALNNPQFNNGANCGRTLMFRGTTTGCTTCGMNPISTAWQKGQVTNLCPECKYGDLDMGIAGDGRCASHIRHPYRQCVK